MRDDDYREDETEMVECDAEEAGGDDGWTGDLVGLQAPAVEVAQPVGEEEGEEGAPEEELVHEEGHERLQGAFGDGGYKEGPPVAHARELGHLVRGRTERRSASAGAINAEGECGRCSPPQSNRPRSGKRPAVAAPAAIRGEYAYCCVSGVELERMSSREGQIHRINYCKSHVL